MESKVCPGCGTEGRRYGLRWHYNCGSDVTEKDVFYPAVTCLTKQLAAKDARIAELTEEVERLRAGANEAKLALDGFVKDACFCKRDTILVDSVIDVVCHLDAMLVDL